MDGVFMQSSNRRRAAQFKSFVNLFSMAFVFTSLVVHAKAFAVESILVTGSSTIAPLISEISKEYEKSHGGVQIETQTGGSAKGIADCKSGRNDVGMVSRELTPDEKSLNSVEIARDGLAFIVNKANPVKNLTKDQILRIYTGKITNWNQVGGPDKQIIAVSKAEGRATLEVFMHYFGVKASEIKAAVVIGDEQQGIKTVAASDGAIAFLGVSTAVSAEKSEQKIHSISFEGKVPTVASVRSSEYPITRKLLLVTCGTKQKLSQDFINYVKSSGGQTLVEKLNFIPL
jgi:phosphate transport system substrate-binding protein